MAITQQSTPVDKPSTILQEIDLVALHPGELKARDQLIAATRDSITTVLRDFLRIMEFSADHISVLDGFLLLFNGPEFFTWDTLNWWEQRKYIQAIKDNRLYRERARILLTHSCLASYIDYSDNMVAKSTEQEIKQAWMRKRLVLKESYWNGIDTISHAAYYQKKYQDIFPAFCVLLCNVVDRNGRNAEMILGIDNGSGFVYKKKSRESLLFHLFYMVYKLFFRKGAFYIGGLELGLLETESQLSCHGSGAVVYQGW